MEKIFKYIVYKTTNLINNKIYIGVHKTTNPQVFDGYLGCDVWCTKPSSYNTGSTVFQKAVKKYGPENFKRQVLQTFDSVEEAYKLEEQLVNKDFITRDDTYNMVEGGRFRSPSNTQKVFIYTKQGDFIKECPSITNASIFIYGHCKALGNICRAAKTGICCGNYQISYERNDEKFKSANRLQNKQSFLKQYENHTGIEQNFAKSKQIVRLDTCGNIIEIYPSINQARKQGYWNVLAVLNGSRKTCNGYVFKYYEKD